MKHKIKSLCFFFVVLVGIGLIIPSLVLAMPPKKGLEVIGREDQKKAVAVQKNPPPAAEAQEKGDGRLEITLESVLPDAWDEEKKESVTTLIRSKMVTPNEAPQGQDFGLSFQGDASWVRLALRLMKSFGPDVPCGEWAGGAGHGALAMTLFGGSVNYLDLVPATAKRAIATVMAAKPYRDQKIKDICRFFTGSVDRPPHNFMERQNKINTAFHILHYLAPDQAENFLAHLYKNTQKGGYVVISTMAPDMRTAAEAIYYRDRKMRGELYPGYGMYTRSECWLTSTGKLESDIGIVKRTRKVTEFTAEEIKGNAFPMGYKGVGIFRPGEGESAEVAPSFVPKGTSRDDPRNFLNVEEYAYYHNASHHPFNPMDHGALNKRLTYHGFEVCEAYYTLNGGAPLYPLDAAIRLSKNPATYVAAVLVMIARKP